MASKKETLGKGLRPGEKSNLTKLVAYQEGSVVSRTLINNKAGTVTLFAFDEGDGLSEHTSPYEALLQVLEGEAEVAIAGAINRLSEGEAIILPAGRPHALKAIRRFKMLLTMIRAAPAS